MDKRRRLEMLHAYIAQLERLLYTKRALAAQLEAEINRSEARFIDQLVNADLHDRYTRSTK